MTTPTEVDIGTLIERRRGVYGGRPVLKGTRFPILQIAVHYQEGLDAAGIHRKYPHLDLARMHAGIARYLANKQQIDFKLEEEASEYAEKAARHPTASPFARKGQ
jgi:uncharacterized protein (DUF433 family)